MIAPITEASGFLNFVVMIPTGGSGFDSGGLYLDSLEELKILVLLVSILCFLLRELILIIITIDNFWREIITFVVASNFIKENQPCHWPKYLIINPSKLKNAYTAHQKRYIWSSLVETG